MNVRCPSCETVYRVDPAKVPAGGVNARCACGNVFRVEHEAEAAGAAAAPAVAAPEALPEEGVPATPSAGLAVEAAKELATAAGEVPRREEGEEGAAAAAIGEAAGAPLAARTAPAGEERGIAAEAARESRAREPVSAGARAPAAPAGPAVPGPRPHPFGRRDPDERARRLARALVSDIVAYFPDRRERALRAGTLRTEFREEIRKSWEEYVAQVGEDMAKRTPYFRAALNEILAGGQHVF